MNIKVDVDYNNKYYVAYSNEEGFKIVGFYSFDIANEVYKLCVSTYNECKIGQIKGQVTIENLFFDYMTKFRGKI